MANKIISYVPESIQASLIQDAQNIFALSYLRQKFHIVIPEASLAAGWTGIKEFLTNTEVPATVSKLPAAKASPPQRADEILPDSPPGHVPVPETATVWHVEFDELERVKLYGTKALRMSGTARIPNSVTSSGDYLVIASWLKANRYSSAVSVEVESSEDIEIDYDSEVCIDTTGCTVASFERD